MKKRLDKLCSLVEGNIVADIGCDHGYLCEMLVEKGVNEIYACEVTEKNLEKAKNNIVNYVNRKCRNVQQFDNKIIYDGGKVTFVLSDGFKNLQILPDCAIIAGMGGDLILKILFDNVLKLPNTIVLQPMSKVELVRKTLSDYYKIVEDKVMFDCGKYYKIIKAVKGKDNLSELQLVFGKTNLNEMHSEFIDYLKLQKEHALGINNEHYQKLLSQIQKVEELYEKNFRISKN